MGSSYEKQSFQVQQNPVGQVGQWSTGLCGCFEDTSNCCITCCCPCITFGRTAEIIDQGTSTCSQAAIIYYALSMIGCACFYSCTYRTKLRALFNLPENPCGDCLVHCCCVGCALCQEYRELKSRGLDPDIGWVMNAQRLNKAGQTIPPIAPSMAR